MILPFVDPSASLVSCLFFFAFSFHPSYLPTTFAARSHPNLTAAFRPETRAKIHLNPTPTDPSSSCVFLPEQITTQFGGSINFEYQHDVYWPELLRISETRRALWMERWAALGGGVGISEWEYREIEERN